MSDDQFKVPVSSLGEVEKIIRAYTEADSEINLSDLEKLVGTSKYTISKNHPFLAEVGIIEGGQSKKITPIGKKLGRALEHAQEGAIRSAIKDVVEANEFLSNLISTVRLKGGLTTDKLVSHILFAAGLPDKKRHNTGARTVIDLLLKGGLLVENDGKIVISNNEEDEEDIYLANSNSSNDNGQSETANKKQRVSNLESNSSFPNISINIELHLPETENPEVYDNLFKSLRENLIDTDNE